MSIPPDFSPDRIAARLGHAFRDRQLLERALTHRSHGVQNNERLEFIGDAVLGCVIAAILYERNPDVSEGELHRMRAHLVNRETLATLGGAMDLGATLRFGASDVKTGATGRPLIVADALEALFGAVFVDGGYDAARRAITAAYGAALDANNPAMQGKDPKTQLQESLAARKLPAPGYAVTATDGEPHRREFTVECRIPALGIVTTGSGASRRSAEQAAAAEAQVQVDAVAGARRRHG